MLMPTTHYDWIKRMRPDFVEAVAQNVRSVEPRRYGLVRDDLHDEFFHRVSRQSVDAHFRATIRAAGHRPEEFSPDELLSMLPPETANKLFTTLEFEWQFFSNFELFGKKSFFFSQNITQKLADTELNVASESVATPFPCCLFAYDNQAARDAYFAMIGLPTRQEGVVTTYVVHYLTAPEEPALGILVMYSDRRGDIPGAAVRHLSLAPGTKLEDALRTDWLKRGKAKTDAVSAGDDEMFFGPGLRMMRIVANSILYLSSANPDVSEGLKEPARTGGSTLSSKEKRRLERSVTKLDYTLVGRSTTPYQGPSAAIGKQLTERIQTRGHWKSQAHGPGRLERKIIFIEPYWRGPDAAEVINKPYIAR
ncbi:hypothetical protein [Rhizobium sp.]|jgi:hypothetical protein|uniref:hypothetical protein n=1 Tax=Rhizobium sp. TaxID=391 RepID=UPI000E97AE9A|nr:hypothetical protein [Rhizobium sp.]